MRFMTAIMLVLLPCLALAETFDDRGVWHPIDGATLAHGYRTTFGVLDVSDRDNVLNALVYGYTPDDSLNITLELRGMMSPNLADSGKSVQIFTTTSLKGDDAIAFADTLDDNQFYPYLMGRLTNADTDSTLSGVHLWLYMQPREINMLEKGN